eukprot:TRINITY_DN73_c3_g1_i1.p1 TRINITY_DN73_c3_g1~~TRINITY_DN73_c3_g1_i1.p1  ORF type:complete len:550 (+),score=119.71 TRINITY_DN73_c3_g1_i1:51-1652(+)
MSSSEIGMEKTVEMFSSRLLRKAYRPDRRQENQCPADVYACEEKFRDLVAIAVENQPMDRMEWHTLCNKFSDEWEKICHWVHPSRLADFLSENMELEWVGEYPVRPESGEKGKAKSNVKAQRFMCQECNTICNSHAQYYIHIQGSKHKEALEMRIQTARQYGSTYEPAGPIPLDSDDKPCEKPQAYYKKSEAKETDVEEEETSSTRRNFNSFKKVTILAMMSLMQLGTGVTTQNTYSAGDYYEPETQGFHWGNTGVTMNVNPADPTQVMHNPYPFDEEDEEDQQQPYYYYDQTRQLQKEYGTESKLNPKALSFISRRSHTTPSDTLSTWSEAESTPVGSSVPSSTSAFSDETDSFYLKFIKCTSSRQCIELINNGDSMVAAAAVSKYISENSNRQREIVDEVLPECNRGFVEDLCYEMTSGMSYLKEEETAAEMSDEQAESIDISNVKVLSAVASLMSFAALMYAKSEISAEPFEGCLNAFLNRMASSSYTLAPASLSLLSESFRGLSLPKPATVPKEIFLHNRRLGALLSSF